MRRVQEDLSMTTSTSEQPAAAACAVPVTHHRTTEIEGVNIFYREAGAAEFHLIDTGHFALEDKADEIVPLIRDFLGRRVAPQ